MDIHKNLISDAWNRARESYKSAKFWSIFSGPDSKEARFNNEDCVRSLKFIRWAERQKQGRDDA